MAQQVRGVTRPRRVPADWVELEHDGIEGTHRCAPSAVAHWEERGWKAVKADKAKKASGSSGAKAGTES